MNGEQLERGHGGGDAGGMSWREYDTRRARDYDRDRAADDAWLAEIREALARTLPTAPAGTVLDLGAGTGLWSDRLSRWFDVHVLAVEPSTAMLTVAAGKRLPGVTLVQARAEAVPIRDRGCTAAWLSTVVHHFTDLRAAAADVRRVVAPRGVVCVRASFPDQPSGDLCSLRFFPSAQQVLAETPTLVDVVEVFGAAGLALQRRLAPREIVAASPTAFVQRLDRRADSLLRRIDDDEFAHGMALARAWADAAADRPVTFTPDLLVFA